MQKRNNPRPFSVRHQINSFSYAFSGIRHMLVGEHNSRIHLAMTLIVTVAGLLLKLSPGEWISIIISMAFVWASEIFNTCIERIMDYLSTEIQPEIAVIKDLASAAVLVASISAVIVGVIIFLPKLLQLL